MKRLFFILGLAVLAIGACELDLDYEYPAGRGDNNDIWRCMKEENPAAAMVTTRLRGSWKTDFYGVQKDLNPNLLR